MKNKFDIIFLILLFILSDFKNILADEFIFKVTDLEILENNTIYKGNNRGKIITNTQVELESDNFIYLKKINRLETNGDVKLTDIKSNILINAEKMFYLKSEEIIYTVGKTLINVDGKYNIEGYDMTLLKNKMILFSNKKTNITDNNSNVYILDQFQYSINEEILKGEKIFYMRNEKENKEDEFYFETGFFNLKKNEFLGKDTDIKFHKTLFGDDENDPRVNAASSYGNEYNTYLGKAVFTSCKKTDKCPPWKINAKRMNHDKIKNQIIYDNAWLELYDFPVAYFPKFFHPGPSVNRQSGLLQPEIGDHDTLGDSLYLPYFFVISDTKDITLKPRLFNDDKLVLQNEYRQITNNSLTLIDASITKGHNSSKIDKGDTRSHFFANTKINLDLEEFINSDLEINFEKISNDNYLQLFDFIKSPLWMSARDTLNSKVSLNLEHENYDFTSSFTMFEALNGSKNSDRYSYALPRYFFSKNFFLDNLSGDFNFNSTGDNLIKQTNISTTTINNNLTYTSPDTYSAKGIKKNFKLQVTNSNSMSDNSLKYKDTPQSEMMSAYFYDLSYPLEKKSAGGINTLIPKLSFRLSPHDMKNNSGGSRRVDVNSVYSPSRTGKFEAGESLTLGFDFKKEKINKKNVSIDYGLDEEIIEISDYFDFKLAANFRLEREKKIPNNSTLGETTSNIFGEMKLKPIKNITLGHSFSLTNDLNTFEYNALSAGYLSDNFETNFSFIEQTGILGDSNVVSNTTTLSFDDYNILTFSTRRNRTISLTEYYDVIYEYKNDCLIAGIKYRKDYYKDLDIIPKEELFFSLTIIPFYTFSPDKMILNKDRIN
jgi:LPS-assembly protein